MRPPSSTHPGRDGDAAGARRLVRAEVASRFRLAVEDRDPAPGGRPCPTTRSSLSVAVEIAERDVARRRSTPERAAASLQRRPRSRTRRSRSCTVVVGPAALATATSGRVSPSTSPTAAADRCRRTGEGRDGGGRPAVARADDRRRSACAPRSRHHETGSFGIVRTRLIIPRSSGAVGGSARRRCRGSRRTARAARPCPA